MPLDAATDSAPSPTAAARADDPRGGRQNSGVPSSGSLAAPVRGRRRPWLMAIGALLACVGALTVVWLVGAAGQRVDVVVIRQNIAYGEVVTADALGIARVSVDPGVQVIPAAQKDALVGQFAATSVSAGTLLSAGMLVPVTEPGKGKVLVPVAMPSERMPAGGLRAGDRILAVTTPDSSGSEVSRSVPAVVVRIGPTDVNGITVVDVTTVATDGPALTIAAAAGQVALVLQPSVG